MANGWFNWRLWGRKGGDSSGEAAPEAAALPTLADPKVPSRPQAIPSMVRRSSTSSGGQKLTETDRQVATSDLLALRNSTNTKAVIRDLVATAPDMSASVQAYIRTVVTRNFRAVAHNQDGTANPEATAAAAQLLNRFNYLGDYTDGFSGMNSVYALAESWVRELRIYGQCCAELVLDKARLPNRIQPVASSQIEFVDDGSGYVFPQQSVNGATVNLDIPTFFIEQLDQDLTEAYSSSPMESAVQPTIMDTEFTNDIRRVIKRALHPRMTSTIDYEAFRKQVPADIQADPEKLAKYMDEFVQSIRDSVNGLNPEDALVAFDVIKFDYLNNGNTSLDREYTSLKDIIDSKVSSGSKAPGAVLGHASGSQNVASTESMLFAKYCEGVQNKVNSMMSRILTLAARLLGYDVYVVFEFDRVDLRPDSELEAFRAMKQSRVLELLSLGLMTDEEASIALTGRLPPNGAPKLSGTFFKGVAPAQSGGNPLSNTAGGALNQTITPDTPQQPKGPAQPIRRVK